MKLIDMPFYKILINPKTTNTFVLMFIGSFLFAQNNYTKVDSLHQYDSIRYYNEYDFNSSNCNYKIAFKNNLVGIINNKNQEVYSPVFSSIIWNNINKHFVVNLDYNYGVLDTLGNWILLANYFKIVSPKSSDNKNDSKAVYVVQNQNLVWGIFDYKASQVLPIEYKAFQEFYDANGFSTLTNFANKKALINAEGLLLTNFNYDDIYFPNKIKIDTSIVQNSNTYKLLFGVKKEDKFGMINENGKVVVPINLDYIDKFNPQNGTAVAKFNNYWGVVNEHGEPIIKFQFRAVNNINNHLFAVKNNEKWKLVSIDGTDKSNFIYEYLLPLKHNKDDKIIGTSICMVNGKFGVLNNLGNEIIKPIYKSIKILSDDLLLLMLDKKDNKNNFGLANFEGKLLQPVDFTHFIPLYSLMKYSYPIKNKEGILQKNDNYFWIQKNGHLTLLSKNEVAALKKHFKQN
jgi:hypothetical protein